MKFQAVKELQSVFKCHIDFSSNLLASFSKKEYDPIFYLLMFYLQTGEKKHSVVLFLTWYNPYIGSIYLLFLTKDFFSAFENGDIFTIFVYYKRKA